MCDFLSLCTETFAPGWGALLKHMGPVWVLSYKQSIGHRERCLCRPLWLCSITALGSSPLCSSQPITACSCQSPPPCCGITMWIREGVTACSCQSPPPCCGITMWIREGVCVASHHSWQGSELQWKSTYRQRPGLPRRHFLSSDQQGKPPSYPDAAPVDSFPRSWA